MKLQKYYYCLSRFFKVLDLERYSTLSVASLY